MSLFGSLTGDFEDDPFFIGAHMQSMQRMNNMMNSMFADPFGMMGPPALMGAPNQQSRQPQMPGMQMMPFAFPPMSMNIGRMFSDLENMSQNPNCHSFTSSSVMTMTSGPDGRPQMYQQSMSTRTGPGGIKETKKSVSDSMTGQRSLAIGHHIGDRAHIIEREQNVHTGDQEERQDFINLDEEEADSFNQEWQSKARRSVGAISNSSYRPSYGRAQDNRPLALPSTAPRSAESTTTSNSASSPSSSSSKAAIIASPSSSELPQNLSNHSSRNNSSSNNNNNNNSSSNNSSSSSPSSRKRERSPDPEDDAGGNKRRSHGDSA